MYPSPGVTVDQRMEETRGGKLQSERISITNHTVYHTATHTATLTLDIIQLLTQDIHSPLDKCLRYLAMVLTDDLILDIEPSLTSDRTVSIYRPENG